MRKALITISQIRRCEAGSAAVEFAFIGMALVSLTVGLLEVGRGLYTYNKLSYAADLGERIVLMAPSTAPGALVSAINKLFSEADQALVAVDLVSPQTQNYVSYRKLIITFSFKLVVPGLTRQNLTLKVERWIPLPS